MGFIAYVWIAAVRSVPGATAEGGRRRAWPRATALTAPSSASRPLSAPSHGRSLPRVQPKGLICAGGEATRLGELTRVANKHLLPVGSWPMIYYPLQLLQLAGIEDVLLVTGKGHAGQMIDLLGDGRLAPRGGGDPILELDLTYKVQTEAGGIAQVVGMAEDFAAGAPLVVVLGGQHLRVRAVGALREWADDGSEPRAHLRQGASATRRTSVSSSTARAAR